MHMGFASQDSFFFQRQQAGSMFHSRGGGGRCMHFAHAQNNHTGTSSLPVSQKVVFCSSKFIGQWAGPLDLYGKE